MNPLFSCGVDLESAKHFLLHCPQLTNKRYILLSTIGNIKCKLLENTLFNLNDNAKILNATINVILLAKRFDESHF